MQTVLARDPADIYIDSIAATLERVLDADVPRLREPVAADAERAIKIVGLVVETLVGFAHGVVAGEIEHATRTWLGAEVSAAWLGAASRDVAQRAGASPLAADRFLATTDPRPLVDELGAQLRPRLRRTNSTIARLVDDLAARTPLADRGGMFAHLRATTLLAERLGDELATGWACACAAIERGPLPRMQGSPRSRALWQAWARLAGLERTVRATYIVRIPD